MPVACAGRAGHVRACVYNPGTSAVTQGSRMIRFALLFLMSANLCCAAAGVDIDTAAGVYEAAAVREQVRASLHSMPDKMRRLFANDDAARLSPAQLAAVEAGAVRGFRIDVFEPPALQALAAGLDAPAVRDSLVFLRSATGRRMVAADVASSLLDETTIDKVSSGEITAPSGSDRDALLARLEAATRSLESAVQIYLTIARGLAIGTAIGSGRDPIAADERVTRDADPAVRAELAQSMQDSLRRSFAYGYRDLSTGDLHGMLTFFRSRTGERYVAAYLAAMNAGFDAMSRRCGENIGESWRELALAERATTVRAAPSAGAAP